MLSFKEPALHDLLPSCHVVITRCLLLCTRTPICAQLCAAQMYV
jgi:hypothetical protein